MIYYTGLGWLSLLLFIAPFIVLGLVLHRSFGIDVLGIESSWPLHSIMLFGGVVTFVFGWYLNRQKFEETIYEKSGPVKRLRTKHTLYWIPMQYWGAIFLLIYFAFFVLRSSKRT
jgi:arginine exporter protein ArgO